MNKEALTKHEIYNKLMGFSQQDLSTIANFIDFLRYKKRLEGKTNIKLEGILKSYNINLSDLKDFKIKTWEHVDQELTNG